MKTDAEREESFPLLLSTKIPLLKSTRHDRSGKSPIRQKYDIICAFPDDR